VGKDIRDEKLKTITTLCQVTLDKKLDGLVTQVGEKILAEKIMKISEDETCKEGVKT